MTMVRVKTRGIIFWSILVSISVGIGLRQLGRSPFFFLKAIQVVWLNEPLGGGSQEIDESQVREDVHLPLGKVVLFDVDLKAVEKDLLSHEWIREVKVKRRFPDSLEISVGVRVPKALIQISKDAMRYVDQEGVVFGHPKLQSIPDLPLLSGLVDYPNELRQSLLLLAHWETAPLAKYTSISSVHFEADRGFRLLVSYPAGLGDKASSHWQGNKFRTMIDLGQEIDGKIDQKISMLSSVIKYLSERSIPVRQIWAEVDKKIVVKTVHGS